jgi:hypothetical protein
MTRGQENGFLKESGVEPAKLQIEEALNLFCRYLPGARVTRQPGHASSDLKQDNFGNNDFSSKSENAGQKTSGIGWIDISLNVERNPNARVNREFHRRMRLMSSAAESEVFTLALMSLDHCSQSRSQARASSLRGGKGFLRFFRSGLLALGAGRGSACRKTSAISSGNSWPRRAATASACFKKLAGKSTVIFIGEVSHMKCKMAREPTGVRGP